MGSDIGVPCGSCLLRLRPIIGPHVWDTYAAFAGNILLSDCDAIRQPIPDLRIDARHGGDWPFIDWYRGCPADRRTQKGFWRVEHPL